MSRLHAFWAMCRRRWRLIAVVSGLAMAVLLATSWPQPRPYGVEIAFIVGQSPLDSTLSVEEERYFNWVASEYIVFGIADWANGTQFYDQVRRRLALDGVTLDLDEVGKAVDAGATRSRLILRLEHPDPDVVRALVSAAAETVMAQEGLNIPQLVAATPGIFPLDNIDDPQSLPLERDENTIGDQLNLPLRLLVGLASGFVVAALVELFDPTIRSRSGLQALKLPLLGEIPEG